MKKPKTQRKSKKKAPVETVVALIHEEEGRNYTKLHTKPPVERTIARIETEPAVERVNPAEEERQEQERTRIKKEWFLETFAQQMGSILHTCQIVGIERRTFYNWRNDDSEFRRALEQTKIQRNDMAESVLIELVREKDPSSVRYFLDRNHPDYKPTKKLEVVTGTRTFEDILWEQAEKRRAIAEGRDPETVQIEATTSGQEAEATDQNNEKANV